MRRRKVQEAKPAIREGREAEGGGRRRKIARSFSPTNQMMPQARLFFLAGSILLNSTNRNDPASSSECLRSTLHRPSSRYTLAPMAARQRLPVDDLNPPFLYLEMKILHLGGTWWPLQAEWWWVAIGMAK